MITVIIPIYRVSDFYEFSSKSYFCDEITKVILINDTPNQDAIILPKDSKFEIVYNGGNIGTLESRLKYLDEVGTEYMFYLDADDILTESLQLLLKYNSDMVYGNLRQMTNDSVSWSHKCVVNSLLKTSTFKSAMDVFKNTLLHDLKHELRSDKICIQEDEYIHQFYKAWLYNFDGAITTTYKNLSRYNNITEVRNSKEYQTDGGRVDYEDEYLEGMVNFVKRRSIEIINQIKQK